MSRFVALLLLLLVRFSSSVDADALVASADADVDRELDSGLEVTSPDPNHPTKVRFLNGGRVGDVNVLDADFEVLGGEIAFLGGFGRSHLIIRNGAIGEVDLEVGTRLDLYGDLKIDLGLFVDPESGLYPITQRPAELPGGASLQELHVSGVLAGGSPVGFRIAVWDIWTDDWQVNHEPLNAVYLNDQLIYSIASHLAAVPEPSGLGLLLSCGLLGLIRRGRFTLDVFTGFP